MSDSKTGRIMAITGPMFSGKTSRLIEFLEREAISGRRIMLFKPDVDTRHEESMVVTHKGVRLPAKTVKTTADGIREMESASSSFDSVGIDEAQFWNEGKVLAEMLDRLAYNGKTIYVSMLNRDHKGEPFGSAVEVLARADTVQSLTAICLKCGEEATFTQRVQDGKEVFGEQVQIGGKESYEPRCRSCFVRAK